MGMNNFWNGKSIEEVTRDYLISVADNLEHTQPRTIDGIVEELCGNITINKDAKSFVGDYFDEAIEALRNSQLDGAYRMSDYEITANLMLKYTAKKLLSQCEQAKEFDNTTRNWKSWDVENLKDDLEELRLPEKKFMRSVDYSFESFESYAYRFMQRYLKEMEGKYVDLSKLANELPLVVIPEADCKSFIKGNFDEAMRLYDAFRDSGFKADYRDPVFMMQAILYQQQKEILQSNPFIKEKVEYESVDHIRLTKNEIEEICESLEKQRYNFKENKFSVLKDRRVLSQPRTQSGRILNFGKTPSRYEILY